MMSEKVVIALPLFWSLVLLPSLKNRLKFEYYNLRKKVLFKKVTLLINNFLFVEKSADEKLMVHFWKMSEGG